jgi:hypothetical protein
MAQSGRQACTIKPLVILAKPNAVQQNVPVDIPCENICPTSYGRSSKINALLICELILIAHFFVINLQKRFIQFCGICIHVFETIFTIALFIYRADIVCCFKLHS